MAIDYAAYFLEVMTLIVLMDQATVTYRISIDKVIPFNHSKTLTSNIGIIFHTYYLIL